MKKITYLKSLYLLIACFCVVSFGFGQTKLAEITFESPGGYTTSIPEFTDGAQDYFLRTDDSNVTGTLFTNEQGSYFFGAQDIDGEGATLPVTFLMNDVNVSGYTSLEFRVHLAEDDLGAAEHWDNPASGVQDYVHISYDIDNSSSFNNLLWIQPNGTGSNNEPSIDTDFDGTGDGTAITDTFTQFTENIAGTGSLLDIVIEFSLNAGGEDIAIDNIEIWGTLIPCATSVTWNGTNWSAAPDITTNAILNASYNTATDGGSFSACSLTVANNSDLFIADNTFVEVQNDITVDAGSSIDVQPYGTIVQKNDFGALTNNGSMTVDKITAPMDAWYEYTYWSSPVSGETFSGAITDLEPSRCYIFNGQNFLDVTAETNNDNTTTTGQDDIDDNGNDWQGIGSTTVMQAGIGYATTLTEFAYNIAPGTANKSFRFTFVGDFHNGIYTVPVYRNDFETADNNWNLIGNPYPSAIDVDLFLAANTEIDETNTFPARAIIGAIFLWSQDTPPSAIANGNQQLNFSDSDFAIINGITQIAGGDGVNPTNRKIPSGQAFFVSYSDAVTPVTTFVNGDGHTIAQGDITFNNGMRTTGTTDNSLFFKNSKTKNKSNSANTLWLNLTSDNGVFNQMAVAYVNEATDDNDGSFYDTQKNSAIVTGAILYSNIEGSDKKFGIQGKASNSLHIDETISLGFKSNIGVATLFKLSIDHLEGDFLIGNTIYLKDNLLNKLHDLSASNYTFTSEVGEFNARFEIVFNANALSTEDINTNSNTLKIVELEDDHVKFTSSKTIKAVRIYDLLGRQLYTFKGQSDSETYKLSNLSSSIYIAKVELSNGAIITKKAFKK